MPQSLARIKKDFTEGLSQISRFWGFPKGMGAIFAALDRAGFTGPASIEVEFEGEPWPDLDDVTAAVTASARSQWSALVKRKIFTPDVVWTLNAPSAPLVPAAAPTTRSCR